MRIGFVGLGLMGLPMVRRLMAAGHELAVFSASRDAVAALVAEGAVAAASLTELAQGVEVFCSCRVTPEQSRAVFLGPGGVAEAGRPGLLAIDFATVDPDTATSIGKGLAATGIGFLDAPISGGPDGAAAGTLSVICGGAPDDVARAQPLFDAFCKRVFHMGPVGTGVTAKLCNNMISITTHALLAEAMVLGVKAGIEPRALYEVLRNSSAGSRTLERVVPAHFLTRDFRPAATVSLIMKDLECAIAVAAAKGVPLHLPPVALARYAEAVAQGHAEDDIAAVILPLERAAGVKVGPA